MQHTSGAGHTWMNESFTHSLTHSLDDENEECHNRGDQTSLSNIPRESVELICESINAQPINQSTNQSLTRSRHARRSSAGRRQLKGGGGGGHARTHTRSRAEARSRQRAEEGRDDPRGTNDTRAPIMHPPTHPCTHHPSINSSMHPHPSTRSSPHPPSTQAHTNAPTHGRRRGRSREREAPPRSSGGRMVG
eukprot:GHVU01186200.1.p1 GENE.GHVU01186200.1~~GHVU01186200.1.p1  ORF type:complete len:211 (-),score=17.50 GHVU01186200.1:50-625(-)